MKRRGVTPPKRCAICRNVFEMRSDEFPCRFKKRTTCGTACRRALQSRTATKHSTKKKRCPACGRMFGKRIEEVPAKFAKRVTCSGDCFLRHKIKLKAEPKRCVVCKCRFSIRGDETASAFIKRKTCSTSCARTLCGPSPKYLAEAKVCMVCKQEFERKPGMTRSAFAARQTCSKECQFAMLSQMKQRPITVEGVVMLVSEAASMLGLSEGTVRRRFGRAP